ncbi:MAG: helix-turn-helix domain-containing protein [Amaricoccus sp.]|uniref:helix-turn-helix domain-containing protein n=1 Tax=Amaricoccus sp. TaxID=1872485 RepID=UPI0039E57288
MVYDCMDELPAFDFAPAGLKEDEAALMAAADLVLTGGHAIFEAKRGLHDNIHPFPSSVDQGHFRRARDRARDGLLPPADQRAIPGPRLGYAGVIDERLDLGLVARLAAARPGWSVVMVGPVVKIDPGSLPQAPNLHWLGQRPYPIANHPGWDDDRPCESGLLGAARAGGDHVLRDWNPARRSGVAAGDPRHAAPRRRRHGSPERGPPAARRSRRPPMSRTALFLRSRATTLDDRERACLEAAITETRTYGRRRTVIRHGTAIDVSLYLMRGTMCRYIDNNHGDRQLVSIQVPGDFVDLHGYPLKVLDHDVATVTEVEVALFRHADLDALVAAEPALARKLWFSTLLDAAIHREWIFKLGRLPSHGRVAHFLCETELRLRAVGLSDGARFGLPLTQPDLAEVCGLTSIHVNRVLRDLREQGLVTVRAGIVDIREPRALARLGEFDPAYLYVERASIAVSPARAVRERKANG